MEKIKQNKKYLTIIPIIAILISILSISVYAVDEPVLLPVSNAPTSDGIFIGSYAWNAAGSSTKDQYMSSNTSNTYICFVNTNSNYSNVLDWVVATDIENSDAYYYLSSGEQGLRRINNTSSDFPNIYYATGNSSPYWFNISIPVYNNINDALSALNTAVANGGSSSGSVYPLSTSFTTVNIGTYLKASKDNASACAYLDNNGTYTLVIGNIDYQNYIYRYTDTSSGTVSVNNTKTYGTDTLYYSNYLTVSASSLNNDIGIFTSLNSALDSIYDYLDSNEAVARPRTAHDLQLVLPPGNVAFIDISGVTNDDCFVTTELTGASYYTVSEFNNRLNYTYGFYNYLPEVFSLPVPNTSKIIFEANGKATVTGTYNQFRSTIESDTSLGQYLVIVNPTYESIPIDTNTVLDINAYNLNNNLNINCMANSYTIYALDVQIGYEDGQSTYQSGTAHATVQGEYNDTTETWSGVNPATGAPASPSTGGNTLQPELSPTQEASQFTTWLKNFLSGFLAIFDAGKSSITTLVGYASSFFGVIGALYTWLPSPVYSVLVSGITLVITIGIIKVFI